MNNPFEKILGLKSKRKAEYDRVVHNYATEIYENIQKNKSREAADKARLEQGQLDAHMTTLLRFSPEATELVLTLKDPGISSEAFNASIEHYNQGHESGAPAQDLLESFTVPLVAGRTLDVDLYKTGRVVLHGAEGTVH